MSATHVIARTAWGEPKAGYVIHRFDALAYFAAEDWLDAVLSGDSDPVGYPVQDVFEHDPALLAELRAASRDPNALRSVWTKATPAAL